MDKVHDTDFLIYYFFENLIDSNEMSKKNVLARINFLNFNGQGIQFR